MQRCVFGILLILLERVQLGARHGGSGYTPELEEKRTTLVFGSLQNQRCLLGGLRRIRDLNMGRLIPLEKNHSQKGDMGAVEYMVRTTGCCGFEYSMVPMVVW